MAKKKKSTIKKVVETVESWVGMGPKATKKSTAKAAKPTKKSTTKTAKPTKKVKAKAAAPKTAAPKATKKGKKVTKKRK